MVHKSELKKGFTLIELLVVVAIIGLLASVVLVSLGNAKKKGGDAAVGANLHTAVNQAELFYLDNGNSYLPPGGSTFSIAACPVYNSSGTNMLSRDKVMADSIAEAIKDGDGTSSCYNSPSAWAVAVGLQLNANTSWCVDGSGASKQVNFVASSAIDPAIFACK